MGCLTRSPLAVTMTRLMKGTHRIIAVTLLTTALCADQALASVPAARPQVVQAARRAVARLAVSFRRVIPAMHLPLARLAAGLAFARPSARPADTTAHALRLLPLLLRLPPPLH